MLGEQGALQSVKNAEKLNKSIKNKQSGVNSSSFLTTSVETGVYVSDSAILGVREASNKKVEPVSSKKESGVTISQPTAANIDTGPHKNIEPAAAGLTLTNSQSKATMKKGIEKEAVKLQNNVNKLQSIIDDHTFSLNNVKSKCNFKYINKATIPCDFFPADGQIKAMEFMVLQKASTPYILYPSKYHDYEDLKTSNFNQTESAHFLEKKAEKIESKIKKVEGMIKNSTHELSSAGKSLIKAAEELKELNIIGVTLKEELAKAGECLINIK